MNNCDEIHVYEGRAEQTGVVIEARGVTKHHLCRSMTDLVRRFALYGDGHFYLAAGAWPDDAKVIDLRKPYWPSMDDAVQSTSHRKRRKALAVAE